jgi:2-oxoglutarate dehydrogenase E2 component (dihydrolipoamide succinyltransferase)
MARFELLLPAMGEGIIEATVTKWLVSEGEFVKINQPVVEIATDKVDSEIPSPVEGKIMKLAYREGEIPKIGSVIALIETNAVATVPNTEKIFDFAAHEVVEFSVPRPAIVPKDVSQVHLKIAPLIRMLARQRGLSYAKLESITGTGTNGRVTRNDLHEFLINCEINSDDVSRIPVSQVIQTIAKNDQDEIVEMSRIRKLIASHMVYSKQTAPHVTSFAEADITSMFTWREKHKDLFYAREQARLTFTPLLAEIVALVLKQFPGINASVDRDFIILRKKINIGIATAMPDGNLIVPVVKNADRENLGSLAHIIGDLAFRAREGSLKPEEVKGGTFTITNIGQNNTLTGTPIINQPESAILALGTISKRPWAVKTSGGYGIALRDIIMLSLTYDHRIIDGAMAGSFLGKVTEHIEKFDTTRDI